MNKNIFDCVDVGTENCPCYLAVTGDCLTCSRLQGKDCCDCTWRGVCVYNEFIQGQGKINNPRNDFEARILHRKFYAPDLAVLILDVGMGFAMKADRPGSYVFLKSKGKEDYYNTPISVLMADVAAGTLHLVIKSISAKTKVLLLEQESLMVRGVYRNGIMGIENVLVSHNRMDTSRKTLLLAKGVGIAPAAHLIEWAGSRGQIHIKIDPDKITEELALDYLKEEPKTTMEFASLSDVLPKLGRLIDVGEYQGIGVMASDYYIGEVRKIVDEKNQKRRMDAGNEDKVHKELIFFHSNNMPICCGEGICGACTCIDENGIARKLCKCRGSLK